MKARIARVFRDPKCDHAGLTYVNRRTVLAALAAAGAAPLLSGIGATPAAATGANDLYTSSTDLYEHRLPRDRGHRLRASLQAA
jgi:hypothetical protein